MSRHYGRHVRDSGSWFYIFAAVISAFVFIAACVIVFLEIYPGQSRGSGKEANAGTGHSSSVPVSSKTSAQEKDSGPQKQDGAASAASGLAAGASADGGDLILVNYDHKLPAGFRPDLVTAYGFQMDRRVAAAYEEMDKAAAISGVSLWISSAYRSNERQQTLYSREVSDYEQTDSSTQEAETLAGESVARPGYSEHATGLALDLNGVRDDFDTTTAFQWLSAHAQDYGFVLRYPKNKQEITKIKYEPWHYRYVGVENAQAMKGKGLCLEEYLRSPQKNGPVD